MFRYTDILLYFIKENTKVGSLKWGKLGPEMYICKFEGYDLVISGNSTYDYMSVIITISGEDIKNATKIINKTDELYYSALELLQIGRAHV